MKLEIEITPEDAACLFADNWESRPVEQVIETMVEEAADRYRASFPQPVVESKRNSADTAGRRHENSMKPKTDPAAADTVQTTNVPAVDLPQLVRLYRNAQRKMATLQKKYWAVNRERKRIDEEIKAHKGVRQSLLDEREKLKSERMEAGRLRATGCSYKEIAKRMGLSNPTMARNRVVQFNKTNV